MPFLRTIRRHFIICDKKFIAVFIQHWSSPGRERDGQDMRTGSLGHHARHRGLAMRSRSRWAGRQAKTVRTTGKSQCIRVRQDLIVDAWAMGSKLRSRDVSVAAAAKMARRLRNIKSPLVSRVQTLSTLLGSA